MQVKPLLEVTNTEEKINQREAELKQVSDKFDKLKLEHDDLEKKHQQLADERMQLADQLQAEVELCNEAEEVTSCFFCCHVFIVQSRMKYLWDELH